MKHPTTRFAYRVAKELGWFNVDAMLESAPGGQLRKWQAYNSIEPFGQDWHQASTIAAAICNEIRIIASGFREGELQESDMYDLDAFIPKPRSAEHDAEIAAQCDAADAIDGLGV